MEKNLLSIGELSRLTHVPVTTIRNWENRYGIPVPERLPSGHRRYSLNLVEKLKLVHHAVASGYKPSLALNANAEELQALLKKKGLKARAPSSLPKRVSAYQRHLFGVGAAV
jgi:MerR family transcriptional regulator, light-induced transcriptional regulator